VFSAPRNRLAVDILGSGWLGPGHDWGPQDIPSSSLTCVCTIDSQRLRFLRGRLAHGILSALLHLVRFIQAGTSKSGVRLAFAHLCLVGQIKKKHFSSLSSIQAGSPRGLSQERISATGLQGTGTSGPVV